MKTKKFTEPVWRTAPISATCEVHPIGARKIGEYCGKPTTHAYKAMGSGWMPLCYEHAQKHLSHAVPITELMLAGEVIIKRDT